MDFGVHTLSGMVVGKQLYKGDVMLKGYKHGHGKPQTKTYRAWYSMKRRCLVPTCRDYKDYGARGIMVCDEWNKFVNFLNDMEVSPEGTMLERKNNNLGYFKDNCYWATPLQQARNTRRNVNITFNGKTMCRQAWADQLGIPHTTLRSRIKAWGIEAAMKGIRPSRGNGKIKVA